MKAKALTLILVLLAAPINFLLAQNQYLPSQIILHQFVQVAFAPTQAQLMVDFGDQNTLLLPALLVPPQGNEAKRNQSGEWLVGARLAVPRQNEFVNFSVLLRDQNGNFALVPPSHWELRKKETFAGSTELLREHLLQRKKLLESWNLQIATQEKSLSRLRRDAEVLADLGKILEINEEIERIKQETVALDRDIEALKIFLSSAKSLPSPRNFNRREFELNREIEQLALATREAEGGALKRRAQAESELQNKLSLIEETRGADLEALRKELATLEAQKNNKDGSAKHSSN